MTSAGIGDRSDVDKPEPKRAGFDEKCLVSNEALDVNLGGAAAPCERRAAAARAIRADGKDGLRTPLKGLQRLIGAIEEKPRAGPDRIGSGGVEESRLARNRRRNRLEGDANRRDLGLDGALHPRECFSFRCAEPHPFKAESNGGCHHSTRQTSCVNAAERRCNAHLRT